MPCSEKHTKFQPENHEWKCPKCGTPAVDVNLEDGFIIETSPSNDDDCILLHSYDHCICYKCGYTAYGSAVSKKLAALSNMVPCPHCNGNGLIKKEDAVSKYIKSQLKPGSVSISRIETTQYGPYDILD